MPEVIAYTDGGCRGNPGPGAWAYLLIQAGTGRAVARAGGERGTTNNRMELSAVIMMLRALRRRGIDLLVRSDSRYTIDCCRTWMPGWKARGWRRKGGELKNVDLLQELDRLLDDHRIAWEWVKGHSGDPGNDLVDGLLNEAMDRLAAGGDPSLERKLTWSHPLGI